MSAIEFTPEHDGTLPIETAVFQALGAASVCWESMAGTGVFDSTRAKEIGDELLAVIRDGDARSGAGLIAAERRRQVDVEGYDAEHDRGGATDLALAAYGYSSHAAATLLAGFTPEESLAAGRAAGGVPDGWPWDWDAWKPTGDPRRDLVKAGALIAAALDALSPAEVTA